MSQNFASDGTLEPMGKEPSELTQQKAKIAMSILNEKYKNQNLVKLANSRVERCVYLCLIFLILIL